MLCERCKQREANVRYTEIINGEVTEHNLCMECARTMDFGGHKYAAALFDGESQLGKLLSGLLGFAVDPTQGNAQGDSSSIVCPVCHTSYAEFVKKSRFGCADCYEVFELLMEDHLKALQGSTVHSGKRPMRSRAQAAAGSQALETPIFPANAGEGGRGAAADSEGTATETMEEKIAVLEMRLKEALREEEYEAAAKYRDAIRALKAEVEAHE